MPKLISDISEIKVSEKSHPLLGSIYEFFFDVSSDDKQKNQRVFASIWWEDLYEYLKWSQDKDGKRPTEQHLNKWRDSVIEKYIGGSEMYQSDVCFYAHKNNQ